jgi:hypothetical protein
MDDLVQRLQRVNPPFTPVFAIISLGRNGMGNIPKAQGREASPCTNRGGMYTEPIIVFTDQIRKIYSNKELKMLQSG